MRKGIRLGGMIVCILLAIGVAILSLNASGTLYTVLLILASLLGVMAAIFKNMDKSP